MTKIGLVIVYTGNGKGKTTAAFGLALRTLGHGKRVCIIQFVKSRKKSGELSILEKYPGSLDIHVTGNGFIRTEEDAQKQKAQAVSAWDLTKKNIASGSYSLVILDELTYLISFGLIREDEVVRAVLEKPASMNLVITGRNAPQSLLDLADIVTEMKEVKHSYSKGIKAQRGIEW